jgi:deoxyribodipyrimidine photo-lyase
MGVIFWFRQDLRLHDQAALRLAIHQAKQSGSWLLPVYVHEPLLQAPTRWGFGRIGASRQAWLGATLAALSADLKALGSDLLQCVGEPAVVLADWVQRLGATSLVCEEIAAPEERQAVERLRQCGVVVHTVWQSTLINPSDLPFEPEQMPDTFTVFRQALERAKVQARPPLATVRSVPALPNLNGLCTMASALPAAALPTEPRSAFPCFLPEFQAGEAAALLHLQRYCERKLPHTYKATRNQLLGAEYSSKWSPWLALGALSPRQAWAVIQEFEQEHGANDGTYWLWFELLWRDYFRFLHCKYGVRLYHAQGLSKLSVPQHDTERFQHWCAGKTGQPWIDAGMRELAATGYLSNRMRQNVASYLIHDLQCDWRAGAAWFEAQLLDFDVYSNQGNWLYLSGRGTDPRGSRRFNPDKQAHDYDAQGAYRRVWGSLERNKITLKTAVEATSSSF